MAKIKCPRCGYTEHDGRPHDKETYLEVCVKCERKRPTYAPSYVLAQILAR